MKTFQLSEDENRIYFQNLSRIPAEEELSEVLKVLEAAGCKIGKASEMGLDDKYECKKDGMSFSVIFTGDEAFIHTEKKNIKAITALFE